VGKKNDLMLLLDKPFFLFFSYAVRCSAEAGKKACVPLHVYIKRCRCLGARVPKHWFNQPCNDLVAPVVPPFFHTGVIGPEKPDTKLVRRDGIPHQSVFAKIFGIIAAPRSGKGRSFAVWDIVKTLSGFLLPQRSLKGRVASFFVGLTEDFGFYRAQGPRKGSARLVGGFSWSWAFS